MSRKFLQSLGAGAAVLGMLVSMTSIASADEFATSTTALTQTDTVTVWVVATDDDVNGDVDHGACNIGSGKNKPFVEASVVSSDPAVASVDKEKLTFSGCGDTFAQDVEVTLIPDLCLPKTAMITISESNRGPGNSVKGEFSIETINVSVAASNALDPTCTGGGGGGGSQLCAEPAAPAWAAALLKASNLKGKASKETNNYISSVAHHMTNGAVFDTFAKSDPGYPAAVRSYMVNTLGLSGLASVDAARAIRPGWTCVSTGQNLV